MVVPTVVTLVLQEPEKKYTWSRVPSMMMGTSAKNTMTVKAQSSLVAILVQSVVPDSMTQNKDVTDVIYFWTSVSVIDVHSVKTS